LIPLDPFVIQGLLKISSQGSPATKTEDPFYP
jgi:hypothetical protein